MPLSSDVIKKLRQAREVKLTTLDEKGRQGTVPVWFQFDGTRILVTSDRAALKVRKIRSNPKVIVTVGVGPEKRSIECKCRLREDRDEIERVFADIHERYGVAAENWWGKLTPTLISKVRNERVVLEITLVKTLPQPIEPAFTDSDYK